MNTNDQLQQLLFILTPNERRYLTIYLGKEKGHSNILRMIELSEGAKNKSDTWLAGKLSISRSALTNLKHQTYRIILKYMRVYNEGRTIDYQLREWTLNAYFLFERRLYDQSLKELERAIECADQHDRLAILSDLLALQAKIVIERNSGDLSTATFAIHRQLANTLHDLTAEMKMKELRECSFLFLRTRFQVRSEDLHNELTALFNQLPDKYESDRLSYRHHRLYAEANRHLCLNQFNEAALLYQQLLQEWQKEPSRIKSDPLTYSKLLSNYSTTLFSAGNFSAVGEVTKQMRMLPTNTTEEEAELFQNTYYMDLLSLMNTDGYDQLDPLVKEIEKGLNKYKTKINKARQITFFHNISMAYFLLHDWKKSLYWIEQIIAQEKTEHRQDLQHTARMLRLVLWYEFGKHDLLEYELVNVERFLRKRKAWFAYESTVVKYFDKLLIADAAESKIITEYFSIKLADVSEGKTSASLPGLSELTYWAKSKLSGKMMRELLQEKDT
jgi:hypothetical protein